MLTLYGSREVNPPETIELQCIRLRRPALSDALALYRKYGFSVPENVRIMLRKPMELGRDLTSSST